MIYPRPGKKKREKKKIPTKNKINSPHNLPILRPWTSKEIESFLEGFGRQKPSARASASENLTVHA
jgi:hypothetical protein